jgi:hypothetical protein
MTACQHCHRPYNGRAIGTHERFCPERPEIAAATQRLLTDATRPGYAVRQRDYEAATAGTGAATAKVLVRHFGSWQAVCTRFDLRIFSVRGGSGKSALNAPLADDELHVCARRGRLEFAG